MSLSGTLNFAVSTNTQFTIIANDGADPVVGTFNGLPQNGTVNFGNESFHINYTGGDGNDVVLTNMEPVYHPALTIERAGANSVRLLWPTNDPAFSLQFNADPAASNWTNASPLPIVIGTNNVVTNAAIGNQKVYRLIKP